MLYIYADFDIIHSMFKKKDNRKKSGTVIVPNNLPVPPTENEMNIAMIVSSHYHSDVEFIIPIDDYKRKSADILMNGVVWEIKCPTGKSKSTIQNQFRKGSKQSVNLILDSRHTKLKYEIIEKRVLVELRNRPYLKKVILIDKFAKIVEIRI